MLAKPGHLQPARLPPGPLQRALPGRGLARLAGARRRRPVRAAGRAFPANYLVNAGPQPGLRQLLGQRRGRGPRPPGPLRRRLAPGGGEVPPAPLRRRLRPAQRALARHRPSRPTTASTPPAARPSTARTLAPFNERVIDAIRGVDPETLIFYEPLVTFDFGADSQARRHRRPGGRLLLPRLLPAGCARRARLRPGLRAARGHGVRERRQAVDGDRRRPVPDRVRRHRRPRDDRAASSGSPTPT